MPVQDDRSWSLTRQGLDLLLRQLAEDRDAAATEYETIRRKLLVFFRLRGLSPADALADEVIDRVVRKLEAGESIAQPRSYCYAVAQYVEMERRRHDAGEQSALETLRSLPPDDPEGAERKEARLECATRCIKALSREERRLIVKYCEEGETQDGRRHLAEQLGLTYVTLRSRAHRIRARLGDCFEKCVEALRHK